MHLPATSKDLQQDFWTEIHQPEKSIPIIVH